MSDPFAELNATAHAILGAPFIVERTGETVQLCIDETPEENEYGGTRAPSVQVLGEVLPIDYGKIKEGDYLSGAESRYKIIEIMPAVDGSKDIYLKKASA